MPAVADKTDREGIMKMEQTGRLTLPTDADVVAETLRLKNLLGAEAGTYVFTYDPVEKLLTVDVE